MKSFLTDEGFNNANMGLQVLGAAGFTTDWPLEQLVRNGRIPRIYEGTNGIQAMDLVGRKLGVKGGRLIAQLFDTIKSFLGATPDAPYHDELAEALKSLEEATTWIAISGMKDPEQAGVSELLL